MRTRQSSAHLEGRELVLDEARKLFFQHGYAEVSMQQIADAARMTKAALYYHFRNKEDLYASVATIEVQTFVDGLQAALEEGETFRDQLCSVGFFLIRENKAEMGRLMQDMRHHVRPEIRAVVDSVADQVFDVALPFFQNAIDQGIIAAESPDVAGKVFIGMILGQVELTEIGCPVKIDTERLVPIIVETYLKGLAP